MKRPDRPAGSDRPERPGRPPQHRHAGPPHDPNFWGAWEEELRRRVAENPSHAFKAHSPEQQDAWRDFFHGFTGEYPEQHWAFGGRRFRPWHQGDVSFNPFVANLFSQGGGLLPLIVLHLLHQQPRYGNELMTLISDKTADQMAANPGAVYPLMTELENRGLVEGQWDDPRKRTVRIYHLTAKGEREMKRVQAIVTPKLEEAIDVLQTLVGELSSANGSNDGDNSNDTHPTEEQEKGKEDLV